MSHAFDILVIGKGLVGSAAARYLSRGPLKVAVVGPDEPLPGQDAIVHAAHYDEARVQRSIGWERVWTDLNIDAAKAYPELERSTGVKFHHTPGCLYVDPYGGDDYLDQALPILRAGWISGRNYPAGEDIAGDFPYFRFPGKSAGLFEAAPAGYINPRALVRAQCHAAAQQGAVLYRDTVMGLERRPEGFIARTRNGQEIRAGKVLVATGSFANHLGILKKPVALRSKGETVLLVPVREQLSREWSAMPSLLYEWDEDDIEGVYLLPPVTYPDGVTYLKIGANFPEDPVFTGLPEIQDWFHTGDSDRFAPRLKAMVRDLIPGLPLDGSMTKRCIVSYTPDRRPYIGTTLEPGLFLAGGCNGYSAMCSDAMGRVAANLMTEGTYPEGYGEAELALTY